MKLRTSVQLGLITTFGDAGLLPLNKGLKYPKNKGFHRSWQIPVCAFWDSSGHPSRLVPQEAVCIIDILPCLYGFPCFIRFASINYSSKFWVNNIDSPDIIITYCSTWKWMFGRRSFHFGAKSPYFQGGFLLLSFQGAYISGCGRPPKFTQEGVEVPGGKGIRQTLGLNLSVLKRNPGDRKHDPIYPQFW